MRRREFLLNLITEMSSFILEGKPSRMNISLYQELDGIHFVITDNVTRTDAEIEKIFNTLNAARRPELAGYYGSMIGHDLLGKSRLDLLGWQIKHGEVDRHGDGIKIEICVGNERFEGKPNSKTSPDGKQ